jgi:hypothetical protein
MLFYEQRSYKTRLNFLLLNAIEFSSSLCERCFVYTYHSSMLGRLCRTYARADVSKNIHYYAVIHASH